MPPGLNTKVNGPVPGACGVIKMEPLFAPAHPVGVGVGVAVNPVPAGTVVVTGEVVIHPLASVTVMLCGPAATLLNVVVLVGLVCVTAPSSMNVNGGIPLLVTEMVPLLTPAQVEGVVVGEAINPAPAVTITLLTLYWQPFTSLTSTLYVPAARLAKVVLVAPV